MSRRSYPERCGSRFPVRWLSKFDGYGVPLAIRGYCSQKTKYSPLLDLHIVGSATGLTFPVTTPGPTTARERVARANMGKIESKRMFMEETAFEHCRPGLNRRKNKKRDGPVGGFHGPVATWMDPRSCKKYRPGGWIQI